MHCYNKCYYRTHNPSKNDEIDDRDKQDNLEKENALFEAYYAAQRVMPEDEWNECMKYLRKGLPITFRFSGSRECVIIYFQLTKCQLSQ